MAKNRIIEIRESKVYENDRITEDVFWNNGFLDKIAERIDDSDDRIGDIDFFLDHLPQEFITYSRLDDSNDDIILFHKRFKKAYFKDAYQNFKNLASQITLDIYAGDDLNITKPNTFKYNTIMDQLKSQISETDGPYIYGDDGYETIDNFVRGLTENTEYCIGGTVVYTE